MIIFSFIFILIGILLGGMPFSKWIPKLVKKIDITQLSDDGNPGCGNVFKLCGVGLGLVCLILDLCKAILPVLIYCLIYREVTFFHAFVVASPVFGHALGLFNGFKGGKAIASAFGAFVGFLPISPLPFLCFALCYILFSTIVPINPHRFRTQITCIIFALILAISALVLEQYVTLLGGCLVAGIVFIRHCKCFATITIPEEKSIFHHSIS